MTRATFLADLAAGVGRIPLPGLQWVGQCDLDAGEPSHGQGVARLVLSCDPGPVAANVLHPVAAVLHR